MQGKLGSYLNENQKLKKKVEQMEREKEELLSLLQKQAVSYKKSKQETEDQVLIMMYQALADECDFIEQFIENQNTQQNG